MHVAIQQKSGLWLVTPVGNRSLRGGRLKWAFKWEGRLSRGRKSGKECDKIEEESLCVCERDGERERRRMGVGGPTAALLYFLIELLSAQVTIQSVSGCRLLPCQINIDSLLSAFPSSLSAKKKKERDRFRPWIRQQASLS